MNFYECGGVRGRDLRKPSLNAMGIKCDWWIEVHGLIIILNVVDFNVDNIDGYSFLLLLFNSDPPRGNPPRHTATDFGPMDSEIMSQ